MGTFKGIVIFGFGYVKFAKSTYFSYLRKNKRLEFNRYGGGKAKDINIEQGS